MLSPPQIRYKSNVVKFILVEVSVMLELTVTQKRVIQWLYQNKNKWLNAREIVKLSGVQINHVNQAVKKFMDYDMVYFNGKDSVQISPDGEQYCL